MSIWLPSLLVALVCDLSSFHRIPWQVGKKQIFRESLAKVPRSIRESSTSAPKPTVSWGRPGSLGEKKIVPTQGWVSHSYAFD